MDTLRQQSAQQLDLEVIQVSEGQLHQISDRILTRLKLGKQAPKYKAVKKTLDHFIRELIALRSRM